MGGRLLPSGPSQLRPAVWGDLQRSCSFKGRCGAKRLNFYHVTKGTLQRLELREGFECPFAQRRQNSEELWNKQSPNRGLPVQLTHVSLIYIQAGRCAHCY